MGKKNNLEKRAEPEVRTGRQKKGKEKTPIRYAKWKKKGIYRKKGILSQEEETAKGLNKKIWYIPF